MEDVIDRLIIECDRKITRALKRLDEEDAKAAIAISVSEVTQVTVECWALTLSNFLLLVSGTYFSPSAFSLSQLHLLKWQAPEIVELSKQIKEKLKEANRFGKPFKLCYFLVQGHSSSKSAWAYSHDVSCYQFMIS